MSLCDLPSEPEAAPVSVGRPAGAVRRPELLLVVVVLVSLRGELRPDRRQPRLGERRAELCELTGLDRVPRGRELCELALGLGGLGGLDGRRWGVDLDQPVDRRELAADAGEARRPL